VKTHTSARCRKNNSPSRLEPSGVQHLRLLDLQFLQNVSTSAASAGVLTQPRPGADITRRSRRIILHPAVPLVSIDPQGSDESSGPRDSCAGIVQASAC